MEDNENIVVTITTSDNLHCGNSCSFIYIDTIKKYNLDNEEIDTGILHAKCNLYDERLELDKRRKRYPWKRCSKCKNAIKYIAEDKHFDYYWDYD